MTPEGLRGFLMSVNESRKYEMVFGHRTPSNESNSRPTHINEMSADQTGQS